MVSASTQTLTENVKEYAKAQGADLVGVADVDRFEGAPERTKPTYYMPDATSVLALGLRMGDTIVENVRKRRTAYSYNRFFNILYDELDELTHDLMRYIEKQGYSAFPVPAVNPNHPLFLRGDLSHKHVAVAAGLGQIGWNNLFLSPEFGPRVTLTSIVTNAPLVVDALYEGELCNPRQCGYKCAKACYVQALGITETDSFSIKGHEFEHGKHIKWRCLWGCGSLSAVMPMPSKAPTIEELRIGRIRQQLQSVKKTSSLGETLSANLFLSRINDKEVPWCWVACLAACPIGKS